MSNEIRDDFARNAARIFLQDTRNAGLDHIDIMIALERFLTLCVVSLSVSSNSQNVRNFSKGCLSIILDHCSVSIDDILDKMEQPNH